MTLRQSACALQDETGERNGCETWALDTMGSSGVPRNFVRWVGGSTSSIEDREQRERGSGDGSPLVRGSGGSCNLVQEIPFHIVKFS